MRQSVVARGRPGRPATRPGGSERERRAAPARRRRAARARASRATPRATNSHTISDSVQAVTTAADGEERPEQRVASERQARQLHGAASDDGDHGRADPVERPLHPGEAAEADVDRGERQHHHERRQDEGEADERRAERAAADPAEVDRELRRERARGELRERQALG